MDLEKSYIEIMLSMNISVVLRNEKKICHLFIKSNLWKEEAILCCTFVNSLRVQFQ